jgi:hypothetical protein
MIFNILNLINPHPVEKELVDRAWTGQCKKQQDE